MSEEMKQSFTFNERELPSFVVVTGIEYPLLPEIVPLTRTIGRMYGEFDEGTIIKGGEFKFNIKLILEDGMNILEAMSELRSFFKVENFKETNLKFKEQPDYYYRARISGSSSINDMFTHGEGSFTLYASKLIRYKDVVIRTKNEIINIKNESDFPLPVRLDIKFIESFSGNMIITNTHEEGTQTFKLNGLNSGIRQIRILTDDKIIQVGRMSKIELMDIESEWITLEEGLNEISIKKESGELIKAGATISYKESYY